MFCTNTRTRQCIPTHVYFTPQMQSCVFGQTADSYLPKTLLHAELDSRFLNTWPCQWLCLYDMVLDQPCVITAWWLWESVAYDSPAKRLVSCTVTLTGENPQLRNIMNILWPSTPVSGNTKECQGRRQEFADLGTSQTTSAPAASASAWERAAATTRAVGAQEATPAPRLPLGSSGGAEEADAALPHSEAISLPRTGCCSHQGVPAPAERARGERGWLLLQTWLTKCWYYA